MHAGLSTPLDPRNGRGAPAPGAASTIAQQAMVNWRAARLEVAAASSCGLHRVANEDAHTPLGVAGPPFVVADGVGGGALAGLVSRWLVAELQVRLACAPEAPLAAASIERAMLEADAALARRIAEYTDAPGAATVALAAPLDARAARWIVAWVGDCRAYRWQPALRTLASLTEDDTFRRWQETPPAGSSPDDPARMVGNGATAGANVALQALDDGDLLVLCSDGVHRHVDAEGWSRVLAPEGDLRARCQALVRAARANGSTDDATVLLVRPMRDEPAPRARGPRARHGGFST